MHKIIAFILLTTFSLGVVYTALPATTALAACDERVLTFPTWYNGITDANCKIAITELNDFWKIVLNVVEILIQLAAYLAAAYIIWGGFKYIKSQGNSSAVTEAKTVIINSLVALVIAVSATALVEFVASQF